MAEARSLPRAVKATQTNSWQVPPSGPKKKTETRSPYFMFLRDSDSDNDTPPNRGSEGGRGGRRSEEGRRRTREEGDEGVREGGRGMQRNAMQCIAMRCKHVGHELNPACSPGARGIQAVGPRPSQKNPIASGNFFVFCFVVSRLVFDCAGRGKLGSPPSKPMTFI